MSDAGADSQPLFVIGAPRSGTTFLCNVLNAHDEIGLTNESRLFVELSHRLDPSRARDDLIGAEFQTAWRRFLRRHAGEWIERFYREELGITARVWGDKHPPYADPTLMSGREGARMLEPVQGSCLPLIREIFPSAKFIHIHRHPGRVARSLARKDWIGGFADGVEVWRQYLVEIEGFFERLPAARRLTLAHHELTGSPAETARKIGGFLDLADPGPIARFLTAQRDKPTPFSAPMSDLEAGPAAAAADEAAALAQLGDYAGRFGYR